MSGFDFACAYIAGSLLAIDLTACVLVLVACFACLFDRHAPKAREVVVPRMWTVRR